MVTHTNCLRNDRLQVPKQIFPVVNVWHALPNDVDFTSLTRFYNLILKVDFLILSNGFSSHIFCSCTSSTSYYVHSPMFLCVSAFCVFCRQLLYELQLHLKQLYVLRWSLVYAVMYYVCYWAN